MLIKTLLNRMEKFKSFVFCKVWIEESQGEDARKSLQALFKTAK